MMGNILENYFKPAVIAGSGIDKNTMARCGKVIHDQRDTGKVNKTCSRILA
jgi:hypothetical protein